MSWMTRSCRPGTVANGLFASILCTRRHANAVYLGRLPRARGAVAGMHFTSISSIEERQVAMSHGSSVRLFLPADKDERGLVPFVQKDVPMTTHHTSSRSCRICGKSFPAKDVVPGEIVRKEIADEILKTVPDWSPAMFICRSDLAMIRGRYVHSLLESDKGELSSLEHEVVRSLQEHEILAANIDAEFEQKWSFGERMADRIATFGGSWAFLICFGIFLVLWIAMNSLVLLWRPLDPYPFIFLNLILSCLAAVQAPIIMMSQNRQEAKDRIRSEHDYQVNLKAELEIRHLHEKVDHLLSHQWERLVRIQELQMEALSELGSK